MDKYGGGGDIGCYLMAHVVAAYTLVGIFAVIGLLVLLVSSFIDKLLRIDTATLHKASMAMATTNMTTKIILGILTASKKNKLSQRDFALAHQIIGYGTLAATTTGFLV